MTQAERDKAIASRTGELESNEEFQQDAYESFQKAVHDKNHELGAADHPLVAWFAEWGPYPTTALFAIFCFFQDASRAVCDSDGS